MLSTNADIPPEFSRPEVVAILKRILLGPEISGLVSRIMIIAQISDTHMALDSPDADQRIRDFERTIADINALDPAPDVIVHSGDIVHNGRQDEYAEAVRSSLRRRAPVYVMPGNKDDRANLARGFFSARLSGAGFRLHRLFGREIIR